MALKNKLGLIIGASTGIGKECAKHFAALGAQLVLFDIQKEKGEELAQKLRKEGNEAYFFAGDVTQEESHIQVMDFILAKFGRLDFALNNAGIEQKPARLIDIDQLTWQRLFDINLKGIWLGMKHQINQMLEQKQGAIVNTASIAGIKAVPGIGVYNTTKAGVVMLTRSAALECAENNIRINSLSPGLIETEMAIRMKEEHPSYYQEHLLKGIPMKRAGQPIEIAQAAAFLCDDTVPFLTGHNLVVDGGFLA